MIEYNKQSCVWVTRPREQSATLCSLLKVAGLLPVRFPVIDIQPVTGSAELQALFQQIAKYKLIVFISRNAVDIAFEHYIKCSELPDDLVIVAIGKSTAETLESVGVKEVLHADTVADSETLLSLPELQSSEINGKQLLIVKGAGGRDLLFRTLTGRGASVDEAEVYLRKRPQYDTNDCIQLWQETTPDAIIVTSNEGIDNLVELTPASCKDTLWHTPLVVMSKRNAEHARGRGFEAVIRVAAMKNDSGLAQASTELLETSHL